MFVLATQEAITATLAERYPEGYLEYDKTQRRVMVIPEQQMLFFMDFNEHYPEKVLVLERPYRDYAFNAKNDAPNEAVMVIDGPFAGKTGYFVKFRGQRRMVFQLQDVAVSIPDIWDYHLVRLHNSDGDRQTRATLTARLADSIVGRLQGCGLQREAHDILTKLLETLAAKQSFAALLAGLPQLYEGTTLHALQEVIKGLTPQEASDWLTLAHFTLSQPDFLPACREAALIRPFLTPTSGVACAEGKDYATVRHEAFTEIIREVAFTEPTFYPTDDEGRDAPVSYFAHIGLLRKPNGQVVVFANFHPLFKEYFLLGGAAKEKQLETFRHHCPSLYRVLKGESDVKVVRGLDLQTASVDAFAMQADATGAGDDASLPEVPAVAAALRAVTETTLQICREINSSTHLAIWRRYLRAVWLHQ